MHVCGVMQDIVNIRSSVSVVCLMGHSVLGSDAIP